MYMARQFRVRDGLIMVSILCIFEIADESDFRSYVVRTHTKIIGGPTPGTLLFMVLRFLYGRPGSCPVSDPARTLLAF